MTIETKLTIIEIAKLTATIEGGGFKRSANKAKAIEKFVAAAVAKGLTVPIAGAVLGNPFDLGFEEVRTFLVGELKAAQEGTTPTPDPKPTPAPKTKRESDLDKIITVVNNGRREGSYAHETLALIIKYTEKGEPVTIRKFIAMGGLRINLRYDIKKGFVTVDAA